LLTLREQIGEDEATVAACQQSLDVLDAHRLLRLPFAVPEVPSDSLRRVLDAGQARLDAAVMVRRCYTGPLSAWNLVPAPSWDLMTRLWRLAGYWGEAAGFSVQPLPPSAELPLYGVAGLRAEG
jgi:hypothetical protein